LMSENLIPMMVMVQNIETAEFNTSEAIKYKNYNSDHRY
jgi:hypothetical protein